MKAGKDYLADKPGITTLEQLADVRKAVKETEPQVRHHVFRAPRSALGRVCRRAHQTRRHRPRGADREPRAASRERAEPARRGSSTRRATAASSRDIGSHQADQFLYYTNSTKAKVVAAQTGNVAYPQYPKFEDFGDMMMSGNGGTGYVRVDWYTPDGLATWGDGRLFVLGTEGYIELRKYINVASGLEGRQPPVHRRQEAGALHRLQERAAAVRPAVRRATSSNARRSRRTRSRRCWPPSWCSRRRRSRRGPSSA